MNVSEPQAAPSRLISQSETCRRTSLSRATIYLRVKAGTFPRPCKLSEGRIAFVEHEIDKWIEDRISGRDSVAA